MRQITGATLRLTTRCRYGFGCLEEGDWPPCSVLKVTNKGVVIAEPKYTNCPCLEEILNVQLCVCPSRVGLFERYHI